MLNNMNKIEELLTQFNGTTFASNEDATEHLRLAIKRLMEEMSDEMIGEYYEGKIEDLQIGYNTKRDEIINISKKYVK